MSALTPQSDMPTPTTDKITQAAMETIYLCKFRVSMDGEWLCLRELDDISLTPDPEPTHEGTVRPSPERAGLVPPCAPLRWETQPLGRAGENCPRAGPGLCVSGRMCAQGEHLITVLPLALLVGCQRVQGRGEFLESPSDHTAMPTVRWRCHHSAPAR